MFQIGKAPTLVLSGGNIQNNIVSALKKKKKNLKSNL